MSIKYIISIYLDPLPGQFCHISTKLPFASWDEKVLSAQRVQ
ncbi:hypothetical protein EDC63_10927 [Sulfurirhabdus autotrophica]|uniref:Uncharacterized protein n=1 Tax=Sulfurirhabdus autotrophica TaxID=1706046 RepID=A0A4R3Y111_9PROT|nr:hypothetical protein EDC63_10927 [Sulfurirhabdus autotrophica]